MKRQIKREPTEPALRPGERLAIGFHDWDPDDKKHSSLMLVTDRYSSFSWDFYTTGRKHATLVAVLEGLTRFLEHAACGELFALVPPERLARYGDGRTVV